MKSFPIIIWFRQDLRLAFNPAFLHAVAEPASLIGVYIWSPEEEGIWKLGGASRWWLHHSLKALESELKKKGIKLCIQKGSAAAVLEKMVKQTKAREVVWNIRYEPAGIKQEEQVKEVLEQMGCKASSFHGNLLFPPGSILTRQGNPYQVFTPFYRTCLNEEVQQIHLKVPEKISIFSFEVPSFKIDDLHLLPDVGWDQGFYKLWKPGERGAQAAFRQFVKNGLSSYLITRDEPGKMGTSLLSPHLHFGEISPFQMWEELKVMKHSEPFLRQVIWREFAYHLLVHFPRIPTQTLKEKFNDFPWKKNSLALKRWQKGMTGYPIIDAGMRQLWKTGWMHNRVRMLVASFLVKDLMIHWRDGAKWFWDTLVDADLANNTFGWQWCAGCGADAAPYFRIFNPETQSKRFNPSGDYIRRFVPELKGLPDRWIHAPHLAPEEVLKQAKIVLGKTYPFPIVEHEIARKKSLKIYHEWI